MKLLILTFLFLSFDFPAVGSTLPRIQPVKIDLTNALKLLDATNTVSSFNKLPTENEIPPYLLKYVDREDSINWSCEPPEEILNISYTFDLHTTSYRWVPIDGNKVKIQYWITSP